MADIIDDYWEYLSRYEIHKNYAFWCAFGLMGALLNRRVVYQHDEIEVHGNIYALLVGPQGNGKSTANDITRRLFEEVCPNLAVGASTQSAEDIVQVMSKDDFPTDFVEINGERHVTKPYAFFVNEFKNFIAYAPTRMLNFLGDIYDRKRFKSGTIKRGVEDIINPSLNVIACENPDQLVAFMRNNVMSGGLSRRFVIVNELGYAEPKPEIVPAPEVRERIVKRLRAARQVQGTYKMTEAGRKFYNEWYIEKQRSLPSITNSIFRGYKSTLHVQLWKVCMALDASSDKPMLLFTDELMQIGLSFLTVLEPTMPLLSETAGRNELMGPKMALMRLLEDHNGIMLEKEALKLLEIDLRPWEILNLLEHLEKTEQIYKKQFNVKNSEGKDIPRWFIITPETMAEYIKTGKIKLSK